uniref:Uncharacterized protein n=1 Tax=Pararge aegeria TaxID=116150 RepID=S4NR58_9NEOP
MCKRLNGNACLNLDFTTPNGAAVSRFINKQYVPTIRSNKQSHFRICNINAFKIKNEVNFIISLLQVQEPKLYSFRKFNAKSSIV